MSVLQVANIHLESTANNRIHLPAANTIAIVAAGANVVVANSSTVSIVAAGSNNIVANSSTLSVPLANTFLGPGASIPSYRLYVNGTIYATGDITALSDIAVKENIMTITSALSTVNNLRGVHYTMKTNGEHKIGLIAQEVKKVLPEVVVEAGDNIGIAYQNIVAVLIEAVKELSLKVEKLENK
jgi:hypothetical protein